MSILGLSTKPRFRFRFHPAQTVAVNDDGAFVFHSITGDFVSTYRADVEWQRLFVELLRRGAPLATIRSAVFPLLGVQKTAAVLAQVDYFFHTGVVVMQLAADDDGDGNGGGALMTFMPHGPRYTPKFAPVGDDEHLAFSRFSAVRREDDRIVVDTPLKPYHLVSETPDTDALLMRLMRGAPAAQALAACPAPARDALRDALALLKHDGLLLPLPAGRACLTRHDEGEASAQWDIHDLHMHSRSRSGYTQLGYGEFGGVFPNIGRYEPRPAVRPAWSGETVALARPDMEALYKRDFPTFAGVQDYRRSVREYNEEQPLSLEQLGHLLYRACRVIFRDESQVESPLQGVEGRRTVEFAWRPYPTGGASYELEVYLSADRCAGLDSGFYHYEAERHCLVRIAGRTPEVEELLHGAHVATALQAKPQVVLHIAARFQRVAWKYRAIAYSVILKNAGVLYQTLYLVATAMGIAPCGLGSGDIELFRRITGLDPMVEGSVGDFGLGSLPADYHDRQRR